MLSRLLLAGMAAVSFLAPFSAMAQNTADAGSFTAREVFSGLQVPALDLLKKSQRLDMLDYWDADSIHKAVNGLGGQSWLMTVTPDYLKVAVSPVSTFEVKLLPLKKDTVVMTISTVGDSVQAPDSKVAFYDRSLRPLDTSKLLVAPDLSLFFDIPKGSATKMSEIREMIPFPTVEYSVDKESNDLKARLTVERFMDVDDYNIIKLFLKPEITAVWKDRYKFKK